MSDLANKLAELNKRKKVLEEKMYWGFRDHAFTSGCQKGIEEIDREISALNLGQALAEVGLLPQVEKPKEPERKVWPLPRRVTKAVEQQEDPLVDKDDEYETEFERQLALVQTRLETSFLEVSTCNTDSLQVRSFTQGQYDAIISCLLYVKANLNTVAFLNRKRRTALELRIAQLEARPTMEYRGVWSKDLFYRSGNFVTHRGSLWHANVGSNAMEPGNVEHIWTLAVKRGQNGKDGR